MDTTPAAPAPSATGAAPAPALAAGLPDGARQLMRLAIAALARREHSRSEIEQKLERKLQQVRRALAAAQACAQASAQASEYAASAPALVPGASPAGVDQHPVAKARAEPATTALAGVTRSDVAIVLDRLQSRGLLSDQRMAQVLARTRASRYGRLRIRQELERRGVDRDTIAAVLPAPEQEAAAALALWQRKFGVAPADLKERARQGRFLAARGFAPGIVARILGGDHGAAD
jgi:regulatory protein